MASLTGCIIQPQAEMDGARFVPGKLEMALTSIDEDGQRVRLRGCDLTVDGPEYISVNLDAVGLEDEEVVLDLPAGNYQVALQGDCLLERQDDGRLLALEARLVGEPEQDVTIQPGRATAVSFLFEVRDRTLAFGAGQMAVTVQTDQVACFPDEERTVSCSIDGELGQRREICIDGEFQADENGCALEVPTRHFMLRCTGKHSGYHLELYLDNTDTFLCSSATTETIDLGVFPEGTELVFRLDVGTTRQSYYSGDPARNPDAMRHVLEEVLESGVTRMSFEDMYELGDSDYNDIIFEFWEVGS